MDSVRKRIFPHPPLPGVKYLDAFSVIALAAALGATIGSAYYFATSSTAVTTFETAYLGANCAGVSRPTVNRHFSRLLSMGNGINVTFTCNYEYSVVMDSDCFALERPEFEALLRISDLIMYCNKTGEPMQLLAQAHGVSFGVNYPTELQCEGRGAYFPTSICEGIGVNHTFTLHGEYVTTSQGLINFEQRITVPGSTVDCMGEVAAQTPRFICTGTQYLSTTSVVAQTFGILSLVFTIVTFFLRQTLKRIGLRPITAEDAERLALHAKLYASAPAGLIRLDEPASSSSGAS